MKTLATKEEIAQLKNQSHNYIHNCYIRYDDLYTVYAVHELENRNVIIKLTLDEFLLTITSDIANVRKKVLEEVATAKRQRRSERISEILS